MAVEFMEGFDTFTAAQVARRYPGYSTQNMITGRYGVGQALQTQFDGQGINALITSRSEYYFGFDFSYYNSIILNTHNRLIASAGDRGRDRLFNPRHRFFKGYAFYCFCLGALFNRSYDFSILRIIGFNNALHPFYLINSEVFRNIPGCGLINSECLSCLCVVFLRPV